MPPPTLAPVSANTVPPPCTSTPETVAPLCAYTASPQLAVRLSTVTPLEIDRPPYWPACTV